MRLKLPTIDIKIGSREVDVQPPDVNGAKKDLSHRASDFREVASSGASNLMDAAASGASTLRDVAVDAASNIRDMASDRASDMKDRAPDVNLPDVKLPNVDLPGIDVAKAVAPAAKAVGDGIDAVAESFRSVRKGIDTWRNPPKQQPPYAEAGVALLAGVGGGMALMFFMDPKLGRRRRALLMDKLGRWSRQAGETIQGLSKDMANRTQGITAGVGSAARDAADAAAQADVLGGPDASRNLEEIDRASGHDAGEPTTTAYGTASTGGATASSEIYGQSWGETTPATSQEVGSFADTEIPAEERDRIGSA